MRKFYNEFFYIPKHAKVCEKVMLTRVVVTVTIVILCLAAMSFSAYAYFSHDITSGSSIIKAASFETKVSIQITNEKGESVPVTTSGDYKSHWATFKANETYYITLQHTSRSTAKTGFVIITAEKCKSKYHTQQLGKDGEGNTETIAFKIKPTADTKVTLRSHWGTSSYYDDYKNKGDNEELYITQNEEIKMVINNAVNSTVDETKDDSNDYINDDSKNSSAEGITSTTTETTTSTESVPSETTTTSELTEPVNTTQTTSIVETQSKSERSTETTGAASSEANISQ